MNVQRPHPLRHAETRDIMGVDVTAGTTADMIAELDARLDAGERIKLAFLNAHGSNLAASDEDFRAALEHFTVLNDGVGVNIASRVLHGQAFPDNLNGTDFVPAYLSRTRRTLRIYLLGSPDGVAEEAARVIHRRWPRHLVVGTCGGFFKPAEAPSIARAVAETSPDLVLVALGNPRQELFIQRYFDTMGAPLVMGVGALLDFLAERVVRAPLMVRRLRLEWAWRLMLEPKRLWRRYVLGNFQFLCRLLWARLSGGGRR